MSRGSPSLVALLGLLAVAGYQNRDKLSGLMQNAGGNADYDSNRDNAGIRMESADVSSASTGGGMMGDLRGMLTGAGGGGFLTGLTELIGRFTNPVQAAKARSWVDTGPNGSLSSADLAEVLDEETLDELTTKTGLSRADLLERLSTVLPGAVDHYTPNGRLPTTDEARSLVLGQA